MDRYINGAIREAISKGTALKSKIPGARDLGLFFSSLANTANREIDDINQALDHLYNDSAYNDTKTRREKFSRFKTLSGKLSEIENVVIAAMSRKAIDDEFINKLLYEICKEINYPLPTPVASCLSQRYYHIYPYYNLICIPLLESEFALHLPDIYHELGHPLAMLENPKVYAFQNNLGYFNVEVRKYFQEEMKRRKLNKANTSDFDPMQIWLDCWTSSWSAELFCDLFATFTLGPAYAWSNIHMCTKMSWESYKVPTFQRSKHPPDEARMRVIIHGLKLMRGFEKDIEEIETKWKEFKEIVNPKETTEFAQAVPDKLLKQAAEFCLLGVRQIGCELATPQPEKLVATFLSDCWKQFWKDPTSFTEWEQSTVTNFREKLK